MADAEPPPLFPWSQDTGTDGESPKSGDTAAGAQADGWTFDETTDEWTEPMGRAGTDPFDTPTRPAHEPPAGRTRAARRARAPGAAARTGRVGPVAGLAAVVAVAAGLVLVVVEPRAPDVSEPARESWSAPRSQPAAAGEAARSPATTPRAPAASPAEDRADAIGALDAAAPEQPAAAPEPARDDADASDRADAGPDEPARDSPPPDNRVLNETRRDERIRDVDDPRDPDPRSRSETRAP